MRAVLWVYPKAAKSVDGSAVRSVGKLDSLVAQMVLMWERQRAVTTVDGKAVMWAAHLAYGSAVQLVAVLVALWAVS
jgi:hypothetical protein